MSFHMLRFWVKRSVLRQLARMHCIAFDESYCVHALFGQCFGRQAPKPFLLETSEEAFARVLAYSGSDLPTLQQLAQAFADPTVYAGIAWDRSTSKPMPSSYGVGQRLEFTVTSCPTVRLSGSDRPFAKGSEVDAFLAACWARPGARVERDEVYLDWLRAQFDRRGGARVVCCSVVDVDLVEHLRRQQGGDRRVAMLTAPRATWDGTIEVTDSDAFGALLRNGIGRHRAFGRGLIQLRRWRDAA